MITLTTLLLLSLARARAEEPLSVTYRVFNKKVLFVEAEGVTMSSSCRRAAGYSCKAFAALPELTTGMLVPSLMVGGKNPGAVLCSLSHGRVVRGHDLSKNEISLCQFSDQSLITLGSLADRARSNDEARKPAVPEAK